MVESHDNESIQFDLPKRLKRNIRNIFYDKDANTLNVYIMGRQSDPIISRVDTSSMKTTLEQFNKNADGILNPIIKLLCVYSIKDNLIRYVKFDEAEQKWYSENYPDDPSLQKQCSNDKQQEKNNAELVLEAATANIKKLFVDEYQEPHAAIFVNDHLETIPIKGTRFRNYLSSVVYNDYEMVIDGQTLKNVIGLLSARAEFGKQSEIIKLNLRVAQTDDGKKWYYDLTNKNCELIEITASGWKIVNNLILFHRYNNQQPQVYPSKDYPPDIFDNFIALVLNKTNVDEEKLPEYQILLKCYIICAFIPGFPKAIPAPNGTQGAAKTTLMEFKKMLIDPCIAKTFSFPQNVNELNQQISHNYVAYYDNISQMKDWISDELCRAVSGSGSSRRRLYTDEDDLIRSLMRCIGFNGINIAATKPDLLDRSIFFKLKRISEKDRRYIVELQKEFEAMRPQIFGYILDTLVQVLKWKEDNKLDVSKIPRMADWAGHCEIIARCMGYQPEEFLNAYRENAKIQTEEIMDTSLIATCIGRFVDTDPRFNGQAMVRDLEGRPLWGWIGTASMLKVELASIAQELNIDTKSKDWPRYPNWLVRRLNEIMHTLKDAGIEIAYDRSNGLARNIMIRKLTSLASLPSETQFHTQNEDQTNDGKNDCNDLNSGFTSGLLSQNNAQNQANDVNDGNDDNLHTFDQKPRTQGTISGGITILTDDSDNIENDNSNRQIYENSMATKGTSQEVTADKSHEITSEPDNMSEVSKLSGASENMCGSEKEQTKYLICQNCCEVLDQEPFYSKLHRCEKNHQTSKNISYAILIMIKHLHHL